MSSPRLALLVLGLPLLTGGCAVTAVTAASYGADGASYAETGKTTSDHFMSMVSKKDCALFRVFDNQNVCRPRPDGKDPYHVDYDTAERMPSEDGASYAPPLRQTPDEPTSSWTADAYAKKAESATASAPAPPAAPVVAATEPAPPPPVQEKPVPAPKPAKKKAAKAPAHPHPHAVAHARPEAKPVKKASPNQVASVP